MFFVSFNGNRVDHPTKVPKFLDANNLLSRKFRKYEHQIKQLLHQKFETAEGTDNARVADIRKLYVLAMMLSKSSNLCNADRIFEIFVQPYEDFLRPEDFTECFETMYFL
jgi:hypothetical protein